MNLKVLAKCTTIYEAKSLEIQTRIKGILRDKENREQGDRTMSMPELGVHKGDAGDILNGCHRSTVLS